MGVDLVWTEDSGEESLCQGDYAVTLDIPAHITDYLRKVHLAKEDFKSRV
jgi:hypothetical protein